MKRFSRNLVIFPAALLAFACRGAPDTSKQADAALNSDLSLAQQAQPYVPANSLSTVEQTAAMQNAYAGRAATPVVEQRTIVHHVYEPSRSAARSSAGPVYRAPAPRQPTYHIEKHPQRDAAIGAGAGAIIGAVTSKNKIKGGLIGAAAGGLLGAVIGNNVDKKKVPNY